MKFRLFRSPHSQHFALPRLQSPSRQIGLAPATGFLLLERWRQTQHVPSHLGDHCSTRIYVCDADTKRQTKACLCPNRNRDRDLHRDVDWTSISTGARRPVQRDGKCNERGSFSLFVDSFLVVYHDFNFGNSRMAFGSEIRCCRASTFCDLFLRFLLSRWMIVSP